MVTGTEQVEQQFEVKRYKIQYPVSAYTFPREARINHVRFDDEYMHVELADGRILSVPLRWIPTLHHACAEDRPRFTLNQSRTTMVWDPDTCGINDEVRIADYLSPGGDRA